MNEYLATVMDGGGLTLDGICSINRGDLLKIYGFAIPCESALDAIGKRAPILEIGAGCGYWAYLLRERGVDIKSYDPHIVGSPQAFPWRRAWTEVLEGDHSVVTEYPDRTLLVIWPSYAEDWAYQALGLYRGSTVIYIGEDEGGCTANYQFHAELRARWKEGEVIKIPQWYGLYDRMYIYTRKEIQDGNGSER